MKNINEMLKLKYKVFSNSKNNSKQNKYSFENTCFIYKKR